jgi:hypothetical protein
MSMIRITALLLLLTVVLLAPVSAPAQQAEPKVRNGDWWLSLGAWEQYGFVNGYADCYASEFHGPAAFSKGAQTYIDALNEYFKKSAENRQQVVPEALDAILGAAGEGNAARPQGGGATGEPSESYDGKFWFDAEPPAQTGFVEGYLECHSSKVKDADGRFSKSADEYVARINEAYGITDDTEEVDPPKGAEKIAAVLHRLRDS